MEKRILITGSRGKLGSELLNLYRGALSPAHSELDVTDAKQTTNYIKKTKPDILIHLAAMTSVVKCEEDKEAAWNANVVGTTNVINACIGQVPYLIYMSTPCVFSGKEGNYNEDSVPYPANFYGLTKLVAEQLVLNSSVKKKLVIRGNFVAREPWPYPGAFKDRFGTYLFADNLAKGISEVITKGLTGIVHIAGTKKLSMYDLAKITSPKVKPMTLDDYKGPHLTRDMTLDSKRWKKYMIS